MTFQSVQWALVVGLIAFTAGESAAEGLRAEMTFRVHPVLVRAPLGEVGQIVVTADHEGEFLEALTLSLDGTTDLEDLESVQVFFTKGSQTLSTAERFAQRAAVSTPTVRLMGRQALRRGSNVFWITCTLRESAALGHRVKATCLELLTSAGPIVPHFASKPPGHRVGVALRQAGEEGVHTYRIPALGTTPRGTLLCVYDIRRTSGRDLQGDIDVGLSRSTDGGQSWEPMRVIMDMGKFGGLPQSQNGVGDPGLVIDQQAGEIFVFALWVHAKPGAHQWVGSGSEPGFEIGKTAQFLMVHSNDDGQSWSAPENLTRQIKEADWALLAPSPQQGIQLHDGTLVMPVQGRDGDNAFATLLLSNDHGKTWKMAPAAYTGGNECQAAELSDGSIMLNIRNGGKKRRAVMVTSDRGKTWQEHPTHEHALIEPTCNGSLYRWTSPDSATRPPLLLFANPQDEKKRIRQTIQVSTDDGMTWPSELHLLLDEGSGAGYPSLSRVDDDHIGIVYEGSQAQLVFERISRSELLSEPRGN